MSDIIVPFLPFVKPFSEKGCFRIRLESQALLNRVFHDGGYPALKLFAAKPLKSSTPLTATSMMIVSIPHIRPHLLHRAPRSPGVHGDAFGGERGLHRPRTSRPPRFSKRSTAIESSQPPGHLGSNPSRSQRPRAITPPGRRPMISQIKVNQI